MRRTLGFAVAPLIFFAFFSVAHAQSATQLQAELNALLQQLSALQSQLQTQSGSPAANPVSGTYGRCPSLTRALRQGASGSDVFALQTFLAGDASVYPEGTISGYFGGLTQAAVERLQRKHGIVSSGSPDTSGYGSVGPATRSLIASLCTSGTASTVAPGGNCSLGGLTVANGLTGDFYSVTAPPADSSCASYKTTRQCISGNFSGNATYQYSTCTEPVTKCTVNGFTIDSDAAMTFYSRSHVGVSDACSSYAQIRTCTNGTISGSSNFVYGTCAADVLASCVVDGATAQSGESKMFYFARNIPSSEQCSSYGQTRTCTNGNLSGNTTYKYASCTPAAIGTCVMDDTVLSSGQSGTFYASSTAPVGTTCTSSSSSRTCTNGTLGGTATHTHASCSDTQPCSLDGVSIPNGEGRVFYSARTVAFGSTCSGVSIARTCTNGMLSGTDTYKYGACSVNPPISLAPNAAQLAAALTALESVLHSMLDYLNSWF